MKDGYAIQWPFLVAERLPAGYYAKAEALKFLRHVS